MGTILANSTGDSFQELDTPPMEKDTIVYPFSYVDEDGEYPNLESVVPLR